jgi:hypothetical protein
MDWSKYRLLKDVLPQESWSGKPCVIVGGGPSLKDFDFGLLNNGILSIGINRAFERFEPTMIFSMDKMKWFTWLLEGRYGEEAKEKFLASKALKVLLLTYQPEVPEYIYVVPVLQNYKVGMTGFSFNLEDGVAHGNNSGFGALNLACLLDASPIYLLGYDMRNDNGRTHWHDGHPKKEKDESIPKLAHNFERWADEINKRWKVINLNPYSGLRCFEFGNRDEIFGERRNNG